MSNYQEYYWRKRPLSEDELAQLLEITEDQAENSDINGDSDAEDEIGETVGTPSTRSASSTSELITPSSSGISTPELATKRKIGETENSDIKGDSDAEDEIRVVVGTPSIRSASPFSKLGTPFSSITTKKKKYDSGIPKNIPLVSNDEDYDYDSDDSVADKTYIPDKPLPLQVPLREEESDEDSEELEGIAEDFSIWEKTSVAPTKFINFNFVDKMGPNVQVDSEEPIEFFNVFFTPKLLDVLIQQSNLYATQNHNSLNLTLEELKAFIGVLIIMGFNSVPQLRKYWSKDSNFHSKRITNIFPVKRFLKILRYLHLNDNSKIPQRGTAEYDKLYKIRPIIDHFDEVFSASFTPNRNIAIDESMIAFKGRTTLKQYMPLKPIKRGFKVWAMACSATGYLYSFDIYQGKEGPTEHTLGERVILKLSSRLQNKGFCIYFDNFFTTIPLMNKLSDKGLFGCGTIRQTRKHFPKHKLLEDRKMATGQSDFAVCNEISITKWKDRGTKAVTVCSNIHNAADIGQVLRTNKTGERENVVCPQSIVDYNRYMGGVDRFDQRMAAYNIAWKSRRWWMKLLYYFIDAGIVNSYILYKETLKVNNTRKKALSHLQFRSKLANQLIGDFTARKKAGPPPTDVRFVNVTHLPQRTTMRRCQQCSIYGIQKRSNVMCVDCQVALCIECFVPYHRR